jgi:phosphoribosyl 1,2-cyclic phosphodiesterase
VGPALCHARSGADQAQAGAGVDVHFCGVRGSTPAPGLPFARYGGHTSSVALAHDGRPPTLVLDGGTGLRNVTALLGGAPYDGSILLGHLHWDHVHGLPFFRGGGAPGARVGVQLPAPDGDPVGTLARGMSPPHFPIGPQQLGPGWSFSGLTEGVHAVEGFRVLVREIPHKGGQTFGFRVSDDTGSLAYLSDHVPLSLGPGPDGYGERHAAALELADDVDLLVHDAQFVAAEFPGVTYLGHASVEYAMALAREAGARRLAMFHHSPERTDDEIDAIVRDLTAADLDMFAAAEGQTVHLARTGAHVP